MKLLCKHLTRDVRDTESALEPPQSLFQFSKTRSHPEDLAKVSPLSDRIFTLSQGEVEFLSNVVELVFLLGPSGYF